MTPLTSSDRQRWLVVVVDDDEDLADTIVMLLEAEGFRALKALSGHAAVAIVEAETPDAVLLDYMLPDMSGGELGHLLRALPATKDLHIMMYTSTPEEVVRPVFDGYETFLGKPVLHDRLVQALDRAFASP